MMIKDIHYKWLNYLSVFVIGAMILVWGLTVRHDTAYDDAYITYRYAENLSQGNGLRYNIDQWVLGTTTPLYAAILSLAGLLSIDIVWASHFISLFAWLLTAWFALSLLQSKSLAIGGVVAAILIALQATMLASLGMETAVVVALMLGCALASYTQHSLLVIVLSAMLILARPDGALWIIVLGIDLWRRKKWTYPTRELAGLILILVPWFLYSYFQYGSILPNSALAKIGQNEMMPVGNGMSFIMTWLNLISGQIHPMYGFPLWLLFIAGLFAIVHIYRAMWWIPVWLLAYILIYEQLEVANFTWYFVPPIIVFHLIVGVGFGYVIHYLYSSEGHFNKILRGILTILAAAVVVLSIYGQWSSLQSTLTVRSNPPASKYQSYEQAGRWLSENGDPNSWVATIEIGIIGYYSNLKILDLMGLVTPEMRTHLSGWTDTAVYAVTEYWPRYVIMLTDTGVGGVVGQWWFIEHYQNIQQFGNVSIYERQNKPIETSDYKVITDVAYSSTLRVDEIWFATQQIEPDQQLSIWLQIDTGTRPLSLYQFSLYLQDTQTYERFSLQNIWPYQEFSLYPSDRWQQNDTIAIPLRYKVPSDLTPGTYKLGLIIFDTESNEIIKERDDSVDEIHVGWLRVGHPDSITLTVNDLEIKNQKYAWSNGISLSKIVFLSHDSHNDSVEIGLEWVAHKKIDRDLTVFVHAIDKFGKIVAQTDVRPFEGRFPTTTWQTGEILTDKLRIKLPYDTIQSLDFRIGLYDNKGRVLLDDNLKDSLFIEPELLIK